MKKTIWKWIFFLIAGLTISLLIIALLLPALYFFTTPCSTFISDPDTFLKAIPDHQGNVYLFGEFQFNPDNYSTFSHYGKSTQRISPSTYFTMVKYNLKSKNIDWGMSIGEGKEYYEPIELLDTQITNSSIVLLISGNPAHFGLKLAEGNVPKQYFLLDISFEGEVRLFSPITLPEQSVLSFLATDGSNQFVGGTLETLQSGKISEFRGPDDLSFGFIMKLDENLTLSWIRYFSFFGKETITSLNYEQNSIRFVGYVEVSELEYELVEVVYSLNGTYLYGNSMQLDQLPKRTISIRNNLLFILFSEHNVGIYNTSSNQIEAKEFNNLEIQRVSIINESLILYGTVNNLDATSAKYGFGTLSDGDATVNSFILAFNEHFHQTSPAFLFSGNYSLSNHHLLGLYGQSYFVAGLSEYEILPEDGTSHIGDKDWALMEINMSNYNLVWYTYIGSAGELVTVCP